MTSTQHRPIVYNQELYPFPEGWYLVATRREILKSRLIQKTWMGQNVVVWCDDSGRICVADSVCPHLGADLGPAVGGCVRNGRLVCPFHGFEFDSTGQCASTPYADAPRTAALRVYETREVLGLIFAWWGLGGRKQQWSLPDEPPDQAGWSDLAIRTLRFPGHPQETTENSVDLGHLRYVHGYDSVSRSSRVSISGPLLESSFNFSSRQTIARIGKTTLHIAARASIYGLGYSFVEIHEKSIGMDTRLWVLATPVDGTLIDLSLVSQVREIRKPRRRIAGLGFLPVKMRAPIMNKIMAEFQRRDVLKDVIIWSNKQYRPRPRLCRSDGEIMPFRAYCAQFYADPRDE